MRLCRGAHAARLTFPAPSPESPSEAEGKFISGVFGEGAEHRTRRRVRSPVRADPLALQFRGRDADLEMKARQLLRELGAHKLARGIRVEWNPRLKTCAGRADYRE